MIQAAAILIGLEEVAFFNLLLMLPRYQKGHPLRDSLLALLKPVVIIGW